MPKLKAIVALLLVTLAVASSADGPVSAVEAGEETVTPAVEASANQDMHTSQGTMSTDSPCGEVDWSHHESGLAWTDAMEKDFREVGPISGFDDQEYGSYGKPLSQFPRENQAAMCDWWHLVSRWLSMTSYVGESELSQLAPNRIRYLENYFNSPPLR